MAAQNEAAVVALELERVSPKVPALFDRDDTFYAMIERRPVEIVSARDMRIPLELRPGGYFGHYDPDGGDMGRGAGIKYDKAVITPAFLKHAVEITRKAAWSTDTKTKAVKSAAKDAILKGMREFRRHCNAISMTAGDGVVGTISVVSNAASVDTYTLNRSGSNSSGWGAKLLRFGQKINVYASTLLTNRTSAGEKEITFYDQGNNQIKVAEVSGSTAGDLIVLSGLSATPPVSIKGVKYHHDSSATGSWLGFTRSTTPEIRSNRVNGNGFGFSLSLARLAINKIGDRVGEDYGKRCKACMHPAQLQAYEEIAQLAIDINKTASNEKMNLYFGSGQMAGAQIFTSYLWDATRIDMVDLDVWGRAVMNEADFYHSEDGRRIFELRGASGGVATADIFYYIANFDLFVNNPAATSYIDNLAIPSGY